MDLELFMQLLHEEESPTLDFKKEQYLFVKASDNEKSELLKDILGFANAWRRADAYILIGVEEVRGGKSKVVGIPRTDHLNDHALQQFVNSITNQPVHFHYKAFGFEDKQVGIIRIEEQTRPIYLKRDYGKLHKEKVYVRRGSSTTPSKPATLEEIAQMRVGSYPSTPELFVEFSEIKIDKALGTTITINTELCHMPPMGKIPDLGYSNQKGSLDFDFIKSNRPNKEYYRELANYELARRIVRPIRLLVKNMGKVVANSVRVEIMIPADDDVLIYSKYRMPKRPKRYSDIFNSQAMERVSSSIHEARDEMTINKNGQRVQIEIDCGSLQPGRQIRTGIFYIGKLASGNLDLSTIIFADNLPQPQKIALSTSVTVQKTKISVEELCIIGDSLTE